jgi:predicted Zn-dependent peptidase
MKKYTFLILLFSCYRILFSQERISTYSDRKTDNWTVRIYEHDPMNVREYTLKNGLKVYTSVNKLQPRISTMIAVKTGSKNDPADHTGLAHYLEHMLFKGTDKYGSLDWSKEKPLLDEIDALYELYNHTTDSTKRKSIYHAIDSVSQLAAKWAIANEYDKMCQAIGAEGTNAFTSVEQTVYINDVPANMLLKWIELEAERYRNPVLRLFHTELEAVYEEKNISLDRDNNKVQEKLMATLFKLHNYGKQTTIGTVDHLKNPSLKAIREYYNTYYVCNNMAIILSGDFNPDSAVSAIANKFSYMQPKTVPQYTFIEEYPHAMPTKTEVIGPDAESITIGFRLPGANTREARAAKLIDLLLNNASAGLIDLNLVKKQLVLSANSSVDIMNDYSVFTLTGKPKNGQTLDSVKSLLLAQLKLVQEGKFNDSLLQAILLNSDISRLAGFKDNGSRCNILLDCFVNGSGYQKTFNELWEMRKIKKDEIAEIAKEFLGSDRVEVYKLKGEDKNVVKVTKPEIHPIELNRDKQSDFVSQWLAEKTAPITPVFADFENGIKKDKINGICDYFYVKNEDNRLFNLVYRIDYGRFHNKALPLAMDYLKYLGTAQFSAEEFSKKMYALGCSFQASAADRKTYITLHGPQENFVAALKLMENLFANVSENKAAFADMIDNVKKKRSNAKSNNRSIERQLSQYALYGADNPAKWVLSTSELDALKSADLLAIVKNLFQYTHTVEYYGNAEMVDIKNEIQKSHQIPAAFQIAATPKDFTPLENKENRVYFVNYKQVQAAIYWWNRCELFDPKDEPSISVFNQYFGGDMSSVVFQNIREAKALAYNTYAYYLIPPKAGKTNNMLAYIGCQADKFKDAFASMDDLLNHLAIDENVFALAKESLKNKIETERTEAENLVSTYFYNQEMQYTVDPQKELYNQLASIGIKDIEAFHKAHVAGKFHGIAIMADENLIKPKDLEKYGKVTQLSLEDIFGY